MSKISYRPFGFLAVILCLISLNGCVVSTPTSTPFPTSTETKPPTETLSSTVTPSHTASPSQTVTYTEVPTSFSVQCRDEFKEMVIAGKIKCQGSTGGFRASTSFLEELVDAGIISLENRGLISGIPLTDNPTPFARYCIKKMNMPLISGSW